MKLNLRVAYTIIIFFISLITLTSCGKRKELKQLGCVRGNVYIGYPKYCIGAMTKKTFFLYLDSPYVYVNGGLINSEMTWTKVDSETDCPVDI